MHVRRRTAARFAPLTVAAVWFDWLGLDAAGNWALAAAAAMLVLGVWQFDALRRQAAAGLRPFSAVRNP